MIVNRRVDLKTVVHFTWRIVFATTVLSSIAWYLHENFSAQIPSIPFAPVATIGTAVAFYVGLKNNCAYDRLWEARKIWDEITTLSRSFASYLLSAVGTEAHNQVSAVVHRQILFVNVLRAQLRKHAVWEDSLYSRFNKRRILENSYEEELDRALLRYSNNREAEALKVSNNPAQQIMQLQIASTMQFKRDGLLDGYEASDLVRLCTSLIDQQGKAERIKDFPFPRQYASISEIFVYIFIALIPFALLSEFDKLALGSNWLVIPLSTLIAWIYSTMEKVGDSSENPFENGINDVPLTAICRQIGIDLREILGEELEPQPNTISNDILM